MTDVGRHFPPRGAVRGPVREPWRIGVRAKFDGTFWTIRAATKATSRDNLSSLATTTGQTFP